MAKDKSTQSSDQAEAPAEKREPKLVRVFNHNPRGERGFHIHDKFIPAAGSELIEEGLAKKLVADWPGQLSLGEPEGDTESRLRKRVAELEKKLADAESLK